MSVCVLQKIKNNEDQIRICISLICYALYALIVFLISGLFISSLGVVWLSYCATREALCVLACHPFLSSFFSLQTALLPFLSLIHSVSHFPSMFVSLLIQCSWRASSLPLSEGRTELRSFLVSLLFHSSSYNVRVHALTYYAHIANIAESKLCCSKYCCFV